MAYTNETTHFGFPLPLGTDLTVPMDYNESLEAADTALFEAQTNASGAVGTAGNALTIANEAKTEAASATATANSATATANAASAAANQAVADVAEAKDDALDMTCAVVEETATAQYKHEPTAGGLNYYFRYNDILYKTTATINVGDTIVPNTNCEATNTATELSQINSDLKGENFVSVTCDGVKTIRQVLDTLYGLIDMDKVSVNSHLEYDGFVYNIDIITSSSITVSRAQIISDDARIYEMNLKATDSVNRYYSCDSQAVTEDNSFAPTAGRIYRFRY